jgi:hypothetical protein
MLELANRRVRSADDLSEALDLPVLGTIAAAGSMVRRKVGGAPALAMAGAKA